MTEQQWLSCTIPSGMLDYLLKVSHDPRRARHDHRKARLFACGCLRGIWPLLKNWESRHCIEEAERLADEPGNKNWINTAAEWRMIPLRFRASQQEPSDFARFLLGKGAWDVANRSSYTTVRVVVETTPILEGGIAAREWQRQCALLRCVFGNPFRPLALDRAWATPTVSAVAQSIYSERRFSDLPILADALEEAGCTVADMLDHCRHVAEHCRGCWVLDQILAKA